MKKLITPLLLTVLLLTACTGQQTQSTTDTEAADFPLVFTVDSIGVSMTLKSDIPQDTLLQRTLAQFVCEQMFFDTDDNDRSVKLFPVYQGDFQDFVHRCAVMKWNELAEATFGAAPTQAEMDKNPEMDGLSREELQQQAAEQAATDSTYITTCLMTFRRVAESDSTQTWLNEYDLYVANTAHPSAGAVRLILRKSDGSIVSRQEEEPEMESLEPTEATAEQ